jgi:hypothetical protein
MYVNKEDAAKSDQDFLLSMLELRSAFEVEKLTV